VRRQLLALGCKVAALAEPDDPLTRLEDIASRLTILHTDLMNAVEVRALLADWRPEACVHLAWYVEPGKYLDRLTSPGVMKGLIHRGGRRAQMLTEGTIRVGYIVRELNAYANVVTALICGADGGRPATVCNRPATRAILRQARALPAP